MDAPLTTLCAILRGESLDVSTGEDRECLTAVSRAHRVDRLVAWRSRRIDDDLRAEAILDEVEVRELNRVLAGLEARGVVPIVLKGAALAHTHYEASWLRPRLDADLLIASSQREAVTDILCGLGYTRPSFISGELVTYQMPFERVGPAGQVHALDVHWRISNPQTLADLPAYEELASRADTVVVRGQPMRTPCPVDALLLACVHRAAHHDLSDELLWLYDIHLLATRLDPGEWGDFLARASRSQVRALCAAGLSSAQACFHTSMPQHVLSLLTVSDHRTERSAFFLRRDLTRIDRLTADLRSLGVAGRLRLIVEHVIPPARYVAQKYGVRSGFLLPWFYLRRLIEGLVRWGYPATSRYP